MVYVVSDVDELTCLDSPIERRIFAIIRGNRGKGAWGVRLMPLIQERGSSFDCSSDMVCWSSTEIRGVEEVDFPFRGCFFGAAVLVSLSALRFFPFPFPFPVRVSFPSSVAEEILAASKSSPRSCFRCLHVLATTTTPL